MYNHQLFTNQMVVLVAVISCLVLLDTIPGILSHHVVTQISLYYETICPDSRNFFINQLFPTYEKLNRYMDVELVPFGNANVSYPRHDNKPVFHCQHGPNECYGNRVQACAIEMWKNTDIPIRYVHCMFQQKDWKETPIISRRCAESLKLDWPKISSCADGSEGERLLIANSLKTFNLNPEHTYVPWIVIDKNHTTTMQTMAESNLLKYLCDHYFNHEPQIEQCKQEIILSLSQKANGGTEREANSSLVIYLMATIITTLTPILTSLMINQI